MYGDSYIVTITINNSGSLIVVVCLKIRIIVNSYGSLLMVMVNVRFDGIHWRSSQTMTTHTCNIGINITTAVITINHHSINNLQNHGQRNGVIETPK